MTYDEWIKTVPTAITSDRLWTVTAYRLALFLSSIGWHDVTKLANDARTVLLAGQLYRSLGSIHANYAEGYSYSTGGNRARYFEYSLGSARESRGWYFDGRFVLGQDVLDHRMSLLARIIQLLVVTVPNQRKSSLREDSVEYDASDSTRDAHQVEEPMDEELMNLLRNVPLP